MQLDHVTRRNPVQLGHIFQIRAKLAPITHGNFHEPRFGQTHLAQPVEIAAQNLFHFAVGQLQSVERNQERAVCGIQVADVRNGFRFEQAQQPPDLLVGLDGDVVAEAHQEGTVARRLKPAPCVMAAGNLGEYTRACNATIYRVAGS